MTPKEDKDTLDGATVDQVREIFKKRVQSDEAKAEINSLVTPTFQYPRYTYCLHVDADVLDAVVNRAPKLQVKVEHLVQLPFLSFNNHADRFPTHTAFSNASKLIF